MITVAQARKFYDPADCPNDKELERILASMYALVTAEWDEMVNEKSHEPT
jgi:hypothetical protein